ncbi:MAG: MoxR family ATPase [Methanoregula sp.]|jgi:MoxR-like ATPase|nr:MoxR family ATPase [Methanoregula sp.]
MNAEISGMNIRAEEYAGKLDALRHAMQTVVIGQDAVVDRLIIALCTDGHVLLEGVPGIAKTLTVRTLSQCIACSFARIQFTPDLLPADITGTKIFDQKCSSFTTVRGPVFANCILADEINRAPPKVQSALLEAMQEKQVTIQGETHPLPRPFFVLATQNPIESEGTYPLPDAQVDRFMFKVQMTYPKKDEEIRILDLFTEGTPARPAPVMGTETIIAIQSFTRSLYADAAIKRYVTDLVDATRNPASSGIDAARYIAYGASPRASIGLILGAKARALLAGRGYVIPEDVQAVSHDVLRHRILLTYEGDAEGITPDAIIDCLLKTVPVP